MVESLAHRAVAAMALLVLLPVLLLIALAVGLTSPGPVLFRQKRIGRQGRPFHIYKFRTMVDGASRRAANVSASGDPRVTWLGRYLRACYLDELPQLLNVVKGDMRLVGPRPETPEFVALYTPEERQVLSVSPGLAGPSTLAFMGEAEVLAGATDPETFYTEVVLHQRVQADLRYVHEHSPAYDVRLLGRQLAAIIRKGVHAA